MGSKSKWRNVVGGLLASIALTIITLNIEVFATNLGLDKLLVMVWNWAPSWVAAILSPLFDALSSKAAVFVSVAIIFYFAGLWTKRLPWHLLHYWESSGTDAALESSAEFAEGLYVGNITISDRHVKEELYFEINIRGMNATGDTIKIEKVQGRLTGKRSEKGQGVEDFGELPAPTIIFGKFANTGICHLNEFMIALEQRVPPNLAQCICNLADEDSITLECRSLNVVAASEANEKRTARLPLWDGLFLTRSRQRLAVGRVHNLSANLCSGSAQIRS